MLLGRDAELGLLRHIVDALRDGRSRALVIRGEPGVGKTALLDAFAELCDGCTVLRVTGVQSEVELAYAALHQACAHLVDQVVELPPPQRRALETIFGLRSGAPPDRFLVALSVLSLLSEAAAQRPLVCIVDDAQWLDRVSVQALAVVARRLSTESVALVLAVRGTSRTPELEGLPDLELAGLGPRDAAALLGTVVPSSIDERARDRLMAETQGNPLAILELPKSRTSDEIASGYLLPSGRALAGELEEEFGRRLLDLPSETRMLLLLAAAEPFADSQIVARAARSLRISPDAATGAVRAGLCEPAPSLRMRHPLVRSAVYRGASAEDLRRAHVALAEATDATSDPDRHAWHVARASAEPDDRVAAELERAAERARGRGAPASAATFLRLATHLTADPAKRAHLEIAASGAELAAGDLGAARALLDAAESGPLGDRERRLSEVQRARMAFATDRSGAAIGLLIDAATGLQPFDADVAWLTYLEALGATLFAGPRDDSPVVAEVARHAVIALRGTARASTGSGLLVRGLAEPPGRVRASLLQQALVAYADELHSDIDWLPANAFAGVAAAWLWDDARWDTFSAHHVEVVRASGAMGDLPLALVPRCFARGFAGDLVGASMLSEEVDTLAEVTGISLVPFGSVAVAAWTGDAARLEGLLAGHLEGVINRREGSAVAMLSWAEAMLRNAQGRFDLASLAARRAAALAQPLDSAGAWGLVELVEAASRAGDTALASSALDQLSDAIGPVDTNWALGVRARAHAIVDTAGQAEDHHREAIERLQQTVLRVELARARLLYGEWLRRAHRTGDARAQLEAAHGTFAEIGAAEFARRAARELRATGVAPRRRKRAAPFELTGQEEQIALLASGGLSNPEIAGRLFLSTRTIEYHLQKVFTKLGVTSRKQLTGALSVSGRVGTT